MLNFMRKEIADILRFRWVTFSVVNSNLKVRYKRSFLGFFWSLIGPVVSYGTIAVVFYFGLRMRTDNYFAYFFPGVVMFAFLNAALSQSAVAIRNNEHYIKKIYLPKSIFVLNSVATELTTFFFNLLAITILGLVLGQISLLPKLFLFPVLLIPAVIFAIGLGLILGVGTIFFRDIAHVIPLLLQASFYLTPILYQKNTMPAKLVFLIELNPLSHFIELFRWAFIASPFPWHDLYLSLFWAALTLLGGFYTLAKADNRIVFKL